MNEYLVSTLSSAVSIATPLVIASLGETVTERAGVVNLSLDGKITLSAMVAFVVASISGSIVAGTLAAMITGGLVALFLISVSIGLKVYQFAIGFALSLACTDLAQTLGQNYSNTQGLRVPKISIPILENMPLVGQILFSQDGFVYFSLLLMVFLWFWLFKSRPGLVHRMLGEAPQAAYARGINVNRMRILYTVIGGSIVGIAGAAISLNVKAGWSTPPSMRGDGWIVLVVVIAGGWHPMKVVLIAYLFALLRTIAIVIQLNPNIDFPYVTLPAIPWVLVILLLLAAARMKNKQSRFRAVLSLDPPASLGEPFVRE